MDPTLMFDEAEQLYNDEVLNTRRDLQENSIHLEQLAQYCEQSFLTNCDQQAVFDQSKECVVQSLASVTHNLTKLSTNLFQLLDTHEHRLENLSHQLFCIEQSFENVGEIQSKEKIKTLGKHIAIHRQHKVVQNKCINKDEKKHSRKPIDLTALDKIGHGVVITQEQQQAPLHHPGILTRGDSGSVPQWQTDNAEYLQQHRRDLTFGTSGILSSNGMPPPLLDQYGGYGNSKAMTIERSMAGLTLDRYGGPMSGAPGPHPDRMAYSDAHRGAMYRSEVERTGQAHTLNYNTQGNAERVSSDRGSDRGSDHMSPGPYHQPRFNNWTPSQQPPLQQQIPGDETRRYKIERGGPHGLYNARHNAMPYDNRPDEYRIPPGHPQHPSLKESASPYGSMGTRQQGAHHPGQLKPHAGPLGQYGYSGSRGSLDDSSCSSSSPSLQSYKTSGSGNRTYHNRYNEYDDGSSQPSTNGPLSDSGLGTWVQGPGSDPGKGHPPPGAGYNDIDIFGQQECRGPPDLEYVPSNYIKKVQAIYRYQRASDDELTLPVGAIVYVLQEHSDGWSEGFYKGQCGFFPANFTSVIT